jgi:hypothetical protein
MSNKKGLTGQNYTSLLLLISLVFMSGPEAPIYICTRRGKYTRTSLKEYNNRKANIHLTPPSNLWWLNNTEFGEVKLMMDASLSRREEICQLELRRYILKSDNTILYL